MKEMIPEEGIVETELVRKIMMRVEIANDEIVGIEDARDPEIEDVQGRKIDDAPDQEIDDAPDQEIEIDQSHAMSIK